MPEVKETPKPKPPVRTEKSKKNNIIVAIVGAFAVILILLMGVFLFGLPSGSNEAETTKTETTKKPTTSSSKTKTATDTVKAEEEGTYAGWRTYENEKWAVTFRYPAGWTKTESPGSLIVTLLGPPTPAGGVILNQCSFRIFVEDVMSSITLENYAASARSEPMGGGATVYEVETSIEENPAFKVVDTYADVGQPWKRLRVWTIKNEKAYTFTYTASTNYGTIDYYSMHSTTADLILASIHLP